jgi:hypothetical protein
MTALWHWETCLPVGKWRPVAAVQDAGADARREPTEKCERQKLNPTTNMNSTWCKYSGLTHLWVLNPDLVNKTAAARGVAATKGDNVLDNVEQVMITNAAAGTYTLRVTHKGTLYNSQPQWVSILTTGQTPQPKPALLITDIAVTASNLITLQWSAVVGQRYQVQYRDNVEGPGWTNISGEISAMRTNVSVSISYSPAQPQRFYRIAEVE